MNNFEILGWIDEIETIAVAGSIRDIQKLRDRYGPGRWRKLKGIATVRYSDGTISEVEVHWYEANGIGRRDFKIKRTLE